MRNALVMLLFCCLLACGATEKTYLGSVDPSDLAQCEAIGIDYGNHPQDFWTISMPDHRGWKLYHVMYEEPMVWFYNDGSCTVGRKFTSRGVPAFPYRGPQHTWIPAR